MPPCRNVEWTTDSLASEAFGGARADVRQAASVYDAPMAAPLISIVTAVYNPPREAFEETIRSVLGQSFGDWEWILTDDCSPEPWVRPRLEELAASDPRIVVNYRAENGGIVAASNVSFGAARGEFVALMDNDDVIEPHALETMAAAIEEHDDVDYLYSDQDKMTNDGTRCHEAYAKPDWSPERLRHLMYTGHFSVLRRSLVQEVGGFRPGYDGSQDHDLVLRVTERARRVVHVPEVLYHWREVPGSAAADANAKPYAWDAGVRAVQDHLDRVGIKGLVSRGRAPSIYHIDRVPDLETPVSVIIPTAGNSGIVFGERRCYVVDCVRSVATRSQHESIEFVVVYDSRTPADVLAELRSIPNVNLRLLEFSEPFNFSAKCNSGAAVAQGEVLVFLNDDMEARSEGLVETLIAPLSESGVGMTGGKLYFEDLRIQHAGVGYGDGDAYHSYYRVGPKALGALADLWIDREVTALTGACIAMRRETFERVGGFTETLPANFNDVDLCFKVRLQGLRLVWLHAVELFHFESVTRQPVVHAWEKRIMTQRWGSLRTSKERFSNVITLP